MLTRTTLLLALAGAACSANAQLLNPDFELAGGTTTFANWDQYGNPANLQASTELANDFASLKMFGDFFVEFNTKGVFQTLATTVVPGDEWEAAALVGQLATDPIVGDNIGFVAVVFIDDTGTNLVDTAIEINTGNVVSDQLTRFAASLVAPLAAESVQINIGFQQPVITDAGALHYDDAELNNLSSGNDIPFYNGGFEEIVFGRKVEGWTTFGDFADPDGNIFTAENFTSPPASEGEQSVLMFGQFNGEANGNTSGIFQALPAAEGESWTASADVYNDSSDPIGSGNEAFVSLVFRDAAGNVVGETPTPAADSSTAFDTWLPVDASGTAPAGTATVEMVLGYFQAPAASGIAGEEPGGIVRWDNASLAIGAPGRLCADQNSDGLVTPADFNSWILNFNNNDLRADTNQDGLITPADFNGWILAFNQGATGPICNP